MYYRGASIGSVDSALLVFKTQYGTTSGPLVCTQSIGGTY